MLRCVSDFEIGLATEDELEKAFLGLSSEVSITSSLFGVREGAAFWSLPPPRRGWYSDWDPRVDVGAMLDGWDTVSEVDPGNVGYIPTGETLDIPLLL